MKDARGMRLAIGPSIGSVIRLKKTTTGLPGDISENDTIHIRMTRTIKASISRRKKRSISPWIVNKSPTVQHLSAEHARSFNDIHTRPCAAVGSRKHFYYIAAQQPLLPYPDDSHVAYIRQSGDMPL